MSTVFLKPYWHTQAGVSGLPYLRVTRQSTRRGNLSKGKKEGKEKEGRKELLK